MVLNYLVQTKHYGKARTILVMGSVLIILLSVSFHEILILS
jgi:hypothetical protein